ncbi:MAG: twin-arginine translocase TatA/TatE family subunit [Chitinophagales bacterium]|jgi:sec-independent protein translocase protein TatA|nr:twin-arginine translocase TatA/TatE family subunit [Chitinophagales bacterium]HMY23175.1 twin-arginine translocase TatA/TatE family subunit [Chitinophagales bacterium]HNF19895.1 twin-arginine translocase TatA/TatE family subunit [Chitinophagales bacterium]HNG71803.1 twin-arginine translocase TatA/TatE family subunit [Chitinophagales bacterium]HNI31302.1 twin-arginine translocase TatA/TatE family subunit [Chitinophagales bacterium]
MFGMHGPELWFILAIVVLLFGGKKIPELMRGVGKGIREFNSAKNNLQDEFEKGLKEDESKKLPESK